MENEKDWRLETWNGGHTWYDNKNNIRKIHYYNENTVFYYDENRKLHRADGPAAECFDVKKWFYHGECIECNSQEELERILKLKAFW